MRRFALALSVALVAASAPVLVPAASSAQTPVATPAAPEPASVPGQLLVGYDIGTSATERASARTEAGARRLEDVVQGAGDRRAVELVALPAGTDRDAAIRRFERNPNVAYAEPNWIVTHEATSDDTEFGSLWGMHGDTTSPPSEFGSQAAEAWVGGNTGGKQIVVGVIDEGIDVTHPDLVNNIWVNPYDPVDGRDNDRNGYIDDTHGWDFHNGNRTVYDGKGDDHGTHVAGTIAAEGGNSIGVAGVAWSATMISAKFLGPSGGYTSNAVKAVDYLTNLKARHGLNIVASNNSWGGGGYSQALHDAIGRAASQDILFVAAAGNSGTDNDTVPHFPSSYDRANIVAVASIDSTGTLSSFSNFGVSTVDLAAPGRGILSTLPGGTYGTYSGTSMATPHVTGGVVLARATGIMGIANLKTAIFSKASKPTSGTYATGTGARLDLSTFTTVDPALNGPPVATDDSWQVTAGSILSEDVLANDHDPDGDTLTVVSGAPSVEGLVMEGGTITYTAPMTDQIVMFSYTVSDGYKEDSATVMIEVTQPKTKGGGGGGGGRPAGKGNSTK